MESAMEKLCLKAYMPTKAWIFQDTEIVIKTELRLKNSESSFVFSTTIPKHVYSLIKDYSLDYATTGTSIRQKRSINVKYTPKTKQLLRVIESTELHLLLETLHKICQDAYCMHQLSQMAQNKIQADKFIAVKFTSQVTKKCSSWMHARMGELTNIQFQYFVVYRHKVRNSFDNTFLYNWFSHELSDIGATVSHERNGSSKWEDQTWAAGFDLLPWTQEREEFLAGIDLKFKELSQQLQDALQNVTIENIDKLIEFQNNNQKLLETFGVLK